MDLIAYWAGYVKYKVATILNFLSELTWDLVLEVPQHISNPSSSDIEPSFYKEIFC